MDQQIYPNPTRALVDHCGYSFHTIRVILNRPTSAAEMQSLYTRHAIGIRDHNKLFPAAMVEWGNLTWHYKTAPPEMRQALWKVYFPDTRPHIFHYLEYVHSQDLMAYTGYTRKQVNRALRQPKLYERQVARVHWEAYRYMRDLSSPKRKGGSDPRYMSLHRALHDPARRYKKGEIVIDRLRAIDT